MLFRKSLAFYSQIWLTFFESTSLAMFDTMFHTSMPQQVYSYAIDPKVAEERGLRRYGFHGLSCMVPLAYSFWSSYNMLTPVVPQMLSYFQLWRSISTRILPSSI